jgi:hypothetical protein
MGGALGPSRTLAFSTSMTLTEWPRAGGQGFFEYMELNREGTAEVKVKGSRGVNWANSVLKVPIRLASVLIVSCWPLAQG